MWRVLLAVALLAVLQVNNVSGAIEAGGTNPTTIPDDIYHCKEPSLYVDAPIPCDSVTHVWDVSKLSPQYPPQPLCGSMKDYQMSQEDMVTSAVPDELEPCLLWMQAYGLLPETAEEKDERQVQQDSISVEPSPAPSTKPQTETVAERQLQFAPFTLVLEFSNIKDDSDQQPSLGISIDRSELFDITHLHILETLQAKIYYIPESSIDHASTTRAGGIVDNDVNNVLTRSAVHDVDIMLASTGLTLDPRPTMYEAVTGAAIFKTSAMKISQADLDIVLQRAFEEDAMELYVLRLKLAKDPGLKRIHNMQWRSGIGSDNGSSSPNGNNGGNGDKDAESSGILKDVDWTSTSMIAILCSVAVAIAIIAFVGWWVLRPTRSNNRSHFRAQSRAMPSPDHSSKSLSTPDSQHNQPSLGKSNRENRSMTSSRKTRRAGNGNGRLSILDVETSTFDSIENSNPQSSDFDEDQYMDNYNDHDDDGIDNHSIASNSLYSYTMGGGGTISGMVLEDDSSLSIAPSLLTSLDMHAQRKQAARASKTRAHGDNGYSDGSNRNGGNDEDGPDGSSPQKISPVWSIMSSLQQHFGDDDSNVSPRSGSRSAMDIESQASHHDAAAKSAPRQLPPKPIHVGRVVPANPRNLLHTSHEYSENSASRASNDLLYNTDDNSLVSEVGFKRFLPLETMDDPAGTPSGRQAFKELWDDGNAEEKKEDDGVNHTPPKTHDQKAEQEANLKTIRKSNVHRSAAPPCVILTPQVLDSDSEQADVSFDRSVLSSVAAMLGHDATSLTSEQLDESIKSEDSLADELCSVKVEHTAEHSDSLQEEDHDVNKQVDSPTILRQATSEDSSIQNSWSEQISTQGKREPAALTNNQSEVHISIPEDNENDEQADTISTASSFASALPSPPKQHVNDVAGHKLLLGDSHPSESVNQASEEDISINYDEFKNGIDDDAYSDDDIELLPGASSDLSGQENKLPVDSNGTKDAPISARKKKGLSEWTAPNISTAPSISNKSNNSGTSHTSKPSGPTGQESLTGESKSKKSQGSGPSLLNPVAVSAVPERKDRTISRSLSAMSANSSDSDCYVDSDEDEQQTGQKPPMIVKQSNLAAKYPSLFAPRTPRKLQQSKPGYSPVSRTGSPSLRFDSSMDYDRDNMSVRSDGAGTVDGSVMTNDFHSNRWESATMASF